MQRSVLATRERMTVRYVEPGRKGYGSAAAAIQAATEDRADDVVLRASARADLTRLWCVVLEVHDDGVLRDRKLRVDQALRRAHSQIDKVVRQPVPCLREGARKTLITAPGISPRHSPKGPSDAAEVGVVAARRPWSG